MCRPASVTVETKSLCAGNSGETVVPDTEPIGLHQTCEPNEVTDMTILLIWGLAAGLTVFLLYLTDPYASGKRPFTLVPLPPKLGRVLRQARKTLCGFGPRLPTCPVCS